jgi:hypothetical protein
MQHQVILSFLLLLLGTVFGSDYKWDPKLEDYYHKLTNSESIVYEKEIKRPVLLLDLDNTLIFADNDMSQVKQQPFHDIEIKGWKYRVYERPGLQKFLKEMSLYYDLYIFSAGQHEYVLEVVQKIDPDLKYFKDVYTRKDMKKKQVLTRSGLRPTMYKHIVDIFGENKINVDPKRLIFIDDRYDLLSNSDYIKYMYMCQEYTGAPNDSELTFLEIVLKDAYRLLERNQTEFAYEALRMAIAEYIRIQNEAAAAQRALELRMGDIPMTRSRTLDKFVKPRNIV